MTFASIWEGRLHHEIERICVKANMPFWGFPVLQIDLLLTCGNFPGTLINKDDVTNSKKFCFSVAVQIGSGAVFYDKVEGVSSKIFLGAFLTLCHPFPLPCHCFLCQIIFLYAKILSSPRYSSPLIYCYS